MSKKEFYFTKVGEMKDLITCMQIDNGTLIPKKTYTYDEAFDLK